MLENKELVKRLQIKIEKAWACENVTKENTKNLWKYYRNKNR